MDVLDFQDMNYEDEQEPKSFTISLSDYAQAKRILELKTYSWITLHHCLQPLPGPVLQNLKDVVVSLTLSSLISFHNIVTCIRYLTRLETLSFSMILVDKKYSLPCQQRRFKVPSLKCINFKHRVGEPYNDVFLIEFFCNNVVLERLESFSFTEYREKTTSLVQHSTEHGINLFSSASDVNLQDYNTAYQHNQPYSATKRDETPSTESLTIAKFLITNTRSLKVVQLNDTSIRLGEIHEGTCQNLSLALLHLEHLTYSINDPGQHFILGCQRHLEGLSGIGDIFNYHPEDIERFFGGVCKNYKTLKSIRISLNVVISEDKSPESVAEIQCSVIVDCEVFIQCPALLCLEMDIDVLSKPNVQSVFASNNNKKSEECLRKIGVIYNLHFLPSQLQTLLISGHYLNTSEVELLINKLPTFYQLKDLKLGMSYTEISNRCFSPSIEWTRILFLSSLLNLRTTTFIGCNDQSPDFDSIKNFADTNGFIFEKHILKKSLVVSLLF